MKIEKCDKACSKKYFPVVGDLVITCPDSKHVYLLVDASMTDKSCFSYIHFDIYRGTSKLYLTPACFSPGYVRFEGTLCLSN